MKWNLNGNLEATVLKMRLIDAISTLSACSNDDSHYLSDGSVGINCRWFGTPFYGCVALCKDQFKSTKDAFEVN